MSIEEFTPGSVSSTSSTVTCDNCCKWEPILDPQGTCTGFNKICCGCDDYSYCDAPDLSAVRTTTGSTTNSTLGSSLETPCQKFQPPSSSSMAAQTQMRAVSSSASVAASTAATVAPSRAERPAHEATSKSASAGNTVLVRLPKVSNPVVWSASQVHVTGNSSILTDSGWTVVIMKVTGGPAQGIVSPSLTPTDVVFAADKALAAYVILPEASGATQWWVTVSERVRVLNQCFAILQTASWTILFYRDPMPSSNPASSAE